MTIVSLRSSSRGCVFDIQTLSHNFPSRKGFVLGKLWIIIPSSNKFLTHSYVYSAKALEQGGEPLFFSW